MKDFTKKVNDRMVMANDVLPKISVKPLALAMGI